MGSKVPPSMPTKSLAMALDPIFQVGKASVTPELITAVSEALTARELIKLSVLQNLCPLGSFGRIRSPFLSPDLCNPAFFRFGGLLR